MVPTRLAHYDLIEQIGGGGQARVWRARHRILGREVALKVYDFRAGSAAARVGRERFLREARLAASLDHPNIVSVHEVGEVENAAFIASPIIRGRTLRELLKEAGALPRDDALRIMEALGRAVHFAHERGIIHRDLKPENVMIDEAGEPRLLDFGVARAVVDLQPLTDSGALVGTIAYLSPEQATGRRDLDCRADVWALGVVLVELLSGTNPFSCNDIFMSFLDFS